MVYKYVRNSTRQSWKEDDMQHVATSVGGACQCIWGSKTYTTPEAKGQEQTGIERL